MKALTRNFLSLLLGDVLFRMMGFLVTAYLARVLGQEGFGVISFCLAVLSYAMIASNNGLTVIGTRLVSGKTGDIRHSVSSVIILRLLHAVAAWLVVTAILFLIYGQSEIFFVCAVYLAYLLPSVFLIEWYFQGREQMHIITIGRLIGISVYLIFLFLFVTDRRDILFTPMGYVFGASVNAMFFILFFIRDGMRLNFRFDMRQLKPLWLSSIPVSLSSSMTQLALQVPPIFLAIYGSFESVGVYSVAFRFITMILVFDRLLGFLFFPAVCRWIQQKADLKDSIIRGVRIVSAFSFLFCLCVIGISEYLVEFAFGSLYKESVLILQILTGYACLTFINSIFSYTLIALKRENAYLRSLTWSAAGFIVCLLLFSGASDPVGPAVALVVFEYTCLLLMNYHLKNWIPLKTSLSVTLLICVTLIAVWFFWYSVSSAYGLNIIMVFVSVIPFIIFLTGVRISDIMYLKKITL